MRGFVSLTLLVAGCGAARFKTEHVGTAQVVASVSPGGTAVAGPQGAGTMPLPRGTYKLAMWFNVPRAQVVGWSVQCPGVERTGEVGETFDVYRERRLAELNRMVEQDRQRAATVANAVQSHAPAVVVNGQARVPGAAVIVQGQATAPSGEVIAEAAFQPIVELPYGDVGAGVYTTTIHLRTTDDGACTVTTHAADPVGGQLAVTRIRDLQAEAEERRVAAAAGAADVRVRVRSSLIAAGADEGARARRLAEEARRVEQERLRRIEEDRLRAERLRIARMEQERLDAEARLRAEAEAKLKWEAEAPERERRARLEAERRERERIARLKFEEEERIRLRIIEVERRTRIVIEERAVAMRGAVIAWLVGHCGADPHRRARIESERVARLRRIEIERIERQRRIEIERAEAEQRRLEIAINVRAQLAGYLVATGARLRPPRPAPIVEVAGSAPFDGARWEAGTWLWIEGSWRWQKGGWVDGTRFGATGGADVAVRAPVYVDERSTTTTTTTTTTSSSSSGTVTTSGSATVDIPTSITVTTPAITIDVAPAPQPTRPAPTVRDHRRRAPAPPADAPAPRVRDHRRR